jgi:hypothetical protein
MRCTVTLDMPISAAIFRTLQPRLMLASRFVAIYRELAASEVRTAKLLAMTRCPLERGRGLQMIAFPHRPVWAFAVASQALACCTGNSSRRNTRRRCPFNGTCASGSIARCIGKHHGCAASADSSFGPELGPVRLPLAVARHCKQGRGRAGAGPGPGYPDASVRPPPQPARVLQEGHPCVS